MSNITKLGFLLLLCFAAQTVSAQTDLRTLLRKSKDENYFKYQKEHYKQEFRKHFERPNFGFYFLLHNNPDSEAAKAFGVTEQQRKDFDEVFIKSYADDPEYLKMRKDLDQFYSELHDKYGSNMQDFPAKDQLRYLELEDKMRNYTLNQSVQERMKVMTPEQMQQFRELSIAQMGKGNPHFTADMLEALDLSGEQRAKMKKISDDLAPQLEQFLDQNADWQVRLSNKLNDIMEPTLNYIPGLSAEESRERMQKHFEERNKKLQTLMQEPEFQKALKESQNLHAAYCKALKFQMYDVLTDEQMDRLSELINNPPDYVKLAMDFLTPQPQSDAPSFLDSWKPGDPIPEEYKIHRKNQGRFPKKR